MQKQTYAFLRIAIISASAEQCAKLSSVHRKRYRREEQYVGN